MKVVIEIPDATLEILEVEADRRGMSTEALIQTAVSEAALKLAFIHEQTDNKKDR